MGFSRTVLLIFFNALLRSFVYDASIDYDLYAIDFLLMLLVPHADRRVRILAMF
jgi:hypothetical protein